jgi:hypothetical protein
MTVVAVVTTAAGVRCVDCPPDAPTPEIVYRIPVSGGRRVALCSWHARERTTEDYAWQPERPCEGCGIRLIRSAQIIDSHVFCCTACGDRARRARQQERRKRESERRRQERLLPDRRCVVCAERFTPVQATQTTCSSAHRLAAWRKRMADEAAGGLLRLRERAHMGNPELCEWCPRCRENSPARDGKCWFCDAKTRPIGGDRYAVAA